MNELKKSVCEIHEFFRSAYSLKNMVEPVQSDVILKYDEKTVLRRQAKLSRDQKDVLDSFFPVMIGEICPKGIKH
ncbi:MAG: hypothetical protein IJ861_09090 [Clostridia bacterium]|nr:hypothetical protein [Clostridia bacterium]